MNYFFFFSQSSARSTTARKTHEYYGQTESSRRRDLLPHQFQRGSQSAPALVVDEGMEGGEESSQRRSHIQPAADQKADSDSPGPRKGLAWKFLVRYGRYFGRSMIIQHCHQKLRSNHQILKASWSSEKSSILSPAQCSRRVWMIPVDAAGGSFLFRLSYCYGCRRSMISSLKIY